MRRPAVLLLVGCVLTLVASGCARSLPQPDAPHPRLVTFSPALTRLTFDMGLGEHVVGITSYCRPPEGQSRTVVGDNLNVRVEPILAVQPDMLLVQMQLKHFDSLRRVNPDLRIEHFSIETLSDIGDAMERIGDLVGQPELGRQHKRAFLDRLETLRARTAELPRRRVCFVMGTRNPSGPGRETFINQMIDIAGGTNILAERFEGWKTPGLETITKLAPEVIVCMTNAADAPHAADYWSSLEYPDGCVPRVVVVTDEDWMLPAGHLAEYTERLSEILHPSAKGPLP